MSVGTMYSGVHRKIAFDTTVVAIRKSSENDSMVPLLIMDEDVAVQIWGVG